MKIKQNPIAVAAFFLVGALAVIANAQSAAPEAAQGQWNSLWDYWKVGGFCMYPIGLCSVAAVGLAIYCGIIFRSKKMTQAELVPVLDQSLRKLDLAQTASLCKSTPGILTNVLGAGLERIEPGREIELPEIDKAMEEASVEEVNAGMKPLTYLSVVSQVAPMFGLLGTVTGMIGAFNKIGMGQMGSPEKLASNIGEAMITTAAGLIVAIPTMFVYFGFKAQYTGNISRISSLLGTLTHALSIGMRDHGSVAPGEVEVVEEQPVEEAEG